MIHTRALTLVFAALFFVGRAKKTETTLNPPPVDPNPEPHLASDARERVKALGTLGWRIRHRSSRLARRK